MLKSLCLTVSLPATLLLLSTGCSLTANAPATQSSTTDAIAQPPAEKFIAARKLAWEAAVMVQNPPHLVDTWQRAKIKWRQAIKLLESIPPSSPLTPQVQQKLAIYRKNYATISQRLATEQQAVENLRHAQKMAWAAAVMVHKPPHSRKVLERAKQKWQAAVDLLEPVAPGTSTERYARQKLITYRSNATKISKRILTETAAQETLSRFTDAEKRLEQAVMDAMAGFTDERTGVSYQEYTELVQRLRSRLKQLAAQAAGTHHPVYSDLSNALKDYEFALHIWQAYLGFKETVSTGGLYDDLIDTVPISFINSSTLTQKYKVQTFAGGTQISFRFAVWKVWKRAQEHISAAQWKHISHHPHPNIAPEKAPAEVIGSR